MDTSEAFPFIDGVPPSFPDLSGFYDGFEADWRLRGSFPDEAWEDFRRKGGNFDALAEQLNGQGGREWFRQFLFYRSAAAFYRSLQLFCAFISLEMRSYATWAAVSGYYSRFFFIQSFLNLLGVTWWRRTLVAWNGSEVLVRPQGQLHRLLRGVGSHEIWWRLMEAMRRPAYPFEHIDFVLSRAYFNPDERNRINYPFEYLGGGFNELSWFDSGPHQLMSHFMPHRRADRDVTNIDRFFKGYAYEDADPGDFMGDDAQILWCSLALYLEMIHQLPLHQSFVRSHTIAALAEVHLKQDAPTILAGVIQSAAEILQDGFDAERFIANMQADDISSFWPRQE